MSDQKLWAADPHRFGPGKVHIVHPDDSRKTCCGQFLESCPGKPAFAKEATCKICLNYLPRREERAARDEEWRKQIAELAKQREVERQEYTKQYHAYLETKEWKEKSRLVISRANGTCEGCGKNRATQAHHISYDHIGNEFLWELRAVCRQCHERFHEIEE